MGERVVHGVWAHCIQLRVPHTVLFGEQEGDKLSRNRCGRKEKLSPCPNPPAWGWWEAERVGCSVLTGVGKVNSVCVGGEQGGTLKANLAPGKQMGFWAAHPFSLTRGER